MAESSPPVLSNERGFYRLADGWYADGVRLAQVAADYQTPCYVYSETALLDAYHQLKAAFCHSCPRICYAVKANDSLALLHLLAGAGAGFDIVSGGELQRVLAAGGAAADVVFSGTGKTTGEIQAALAAGVGCFNVEAEQELERIEQCAAALAVTAPVAFRLTLNIDGETHRHLTTGLAGGKFGVPAADAARLARLAAQSSHLDFLGLSCHVGSQVSDEAIYLQLAEAMAGEVARIEAEGIEVRRVDMGGGFAVDYWRINPPQMALGRYDRALAEHFAGRELLIEPGRCIAAPAGALLTTVQYVKKSADKTIWVVDAGMMTLLRPALYDAYHPLEAAAESSEPTQVGDVAGPVCESADVLARDRQLGLAVGECAVLFNAGAYGMVMASNYNAYPRPGALLLSGGQWREIRRPETVRDMLMFESV